MCTRAIWKSIKILTGPKRNTPEISKLKIDRDDVDDPLEMANHFNSYFSTIADKLRDTISYSPSDLSKLINFVESRKDPNDLFSVPSGGSREGAWGARAPLILGKKEMTEGKKANRARKLRPGSPLSSKSGSATGSRYI